MDTVQDQERRPFLMEKLVASAVEGAVFENAQNWLRFKMAAISFGNRAIG